MDWTNRLFRLIEHWLQGLQSITQYLAGNQQSTLGSILAPVSNAFINNPTATQSSFSADLQTTLNEGKRLLVQPRRTLKNLKIGQRAHDPCNPLQGYRLGSGWLGRSPGGHRARRVEGEPAARSSERRYRLGDIRSVASTSRETC